VSQTHEPILRQRRRASGIPREADSEGTGRREEVTVGSGFLKVQGAFWYKQDGGCRRPQTYLPILLPLIDGPRFRSSSQRAPPVTRQCGEEPRIPPLRTVVADRNAQCLLLPD
jgi:hypothetical protein